MSLVLYHKKTVGRERFELFYNTLESHEEAQPTKLTNNGRIWEKKLFDIYSNLLKEDDVVIDVGAYIGTHTCSFSKCCPKGMVYTFEPNKELYKTLLSNIELNCLKNIRPYCLGVSNKHGYNTFYERPDGTSRINNNREIRGDPKSIECVALDSFLQHITKCKLIKIDVEGHEFEVLDGMKQLIEKCKPHILIEVFRNKREKIKLWAEDHNYNLNWLRGDDFYLTPICKK
tara:strand:- start:4681 stop:5370 length:690 start_codon:yes stop_codon:yes gene_type:complete